MGSGETTNKKCEWCGEDATVSIEIRRKIKGGRPGAMAGTGMFVYGCDAHEDTAARVAADAGKAKR